LKIRTSFSAASKIVLVLPNYYRIVTNHRSRFPQFWLPAFLDFICPFHHFYAFPQSFFKKPQKFFLEKNAKILQTKRA